MLQAPFSPRTPSISGLGASVARRLAGVSVLTAGLAVLSLALAPAAHASTPTQLVLPQQQAFGVLGYDCGSIAEHSYATGFDPATGYPTGDVYLSTSCAAGGRGGHSTTITAWAGVEWDFSAATISSLALPTAPSVLTTFTAVDAFGNEVYSTATSAYLQLAPEFVYPPRVTAISASQGISAGGATVTISGGGFTGVTGVSFGPTAAASYVVNGPDSITAISPPEPAGVVDVTVTTGGHQQC